MSSVDPLVQELLDGVCPPPAHDAGNWSAVLRDAKTARSVGQRRRRVLAVMLTIAAAAAFGAFWPFGGGNQVVERAFAARALAVLGDGPVLHVVVRLRSPGWVVDLATGRRERAYAIVEDWYRPGGGLREKVLRSNGGYVAGSVRVTPSPEGSYVDVLRAFATQYQSVLRERRAEVVSRSTLFGRRVVWIRFRPDGRRDPVTRTLAGTRYEVALDERTYRPLYVRSHGSGGVRVLAIDTRATIPSSVAAVPFPDESEPPIYGEGLDGPLSEAGAATLMGKRALWLGRSYAGLPLAWLGGMSFAYGHAPTYDELEHRWRGVNVVYGSVTKSSNGFPERTKPYIQLHEQPASEAAAIRAGPPPSSGALYAYGLRWGIGSILIDGVYVEIEARNEQLLLSVARALEPIPAGR